MQNATKQPIAYIWNMSKGRVLVEIKESQGGDVLHRLTFASKREAKDFAKSHNAKPWNY